MRYWNGRPNSLISRPEVQILPELRRVDEEEIEALKRNIQGMIQEALTLLPQVPPEMRMAVTTQEDPVQLSYFLASVLDLGIETEQKMLESATVDGLLTLTHAALARELEIMQIRSKIANEAQHEMDKSQRDYVLRQQMKAIQKELGDDETGEKAEAEQLRDRLEKADLPDDVRKEATRELKRMEQLPQAAPDYHVIRTYISSTYSNCRGENRARKNSISTRPARCSTKIITASKILRNVFSNRSPSSNCGPIQKARSFCSSARPAWAKRHLAARSHGHWDASLTGSVWAVCGTKPNYAAIAGPISARCPAASSNRFGVLASIIRC